MAEARQNFMKQLEQWPDDFLLRGNFAIFLQATGDMPGAIAQWRLVHDVIPQDYLPWFQMGRLLGGEAQWSEAEADLRLALQIHSSLTEGWFELGNVLASQGNSRKRSPPTGPPGGNDRRMRKPFFAWARSMPI